MQWRHFGRKSILFCEFIASDQFKSYDELKKRLDSVLGGKPSTRIDSEVSDEDDYRGSVSSLTEDLRGELKNLKPTRSVAVDDDEDEDSDALKYFSKLASDD